MVLLLFALAVLLGTPAFAQTRSPTPTTARQSASITVTRTTTPPSVDGHLDDPVWQTAQRIAHFVQQRPIEGAPATEDTEVSIAYDSQNLYFGIYAHYSDPSIVRANRVDRDQTGRDDTVTLFFDPFLDQQRAYVFSVNGYGVQGDAIMGSGGGPSGPGGGPGGPGGGPGGGGGRGGPGGGGPNGDSSWDALFTSAGGLVSDGWTAELSIPFKSLRYPSQQPGETHSWGFQVRRDIEGKNESVVWSPISRDVFGFLRQMGTLEGLADLSTSRNLEFLPTFAAIRPAALDTTTGDYSTLDSTPQVGLNVKYGLTSNLTADFTANPDFSQIESDRQQIVVNERFRVFYPELRPFFLEGQEIFDVPGPVNLTHTRTIVDPEFGAKLTGKVGKTTLGLLYADDVVPGQGDVGDPAYRQAAHNFMGRVRYDLYPESHIGLLATNREFVNSHGRMGGFDTRLRLGTNYRLGASVMATDRVGTDGVHLAGPMMDVNFRKEGRHLTYDASHFQIHPDFGTDLGFVRRVDVRQTNGSVGYRWWPETAITNWGTRFNYTRTYDFDGVLQDEQMRVNTNVQFARSLGLNGGINRDMERYEGVNFWKWRYSLGGNLNTSRRISFGGFMNGGDQIRYVENPFLGNGTSVNLSVTVRPFSRLQSSINLNTSRLTDPRDGSTVFDVKVFRAQTTYQLTPRLLVRNITEFSSENHTIAVNLLGTYRVNSGTVFYVGYDDHYQQGSAINATIFATTAYQRTNRAFFTKLQYLLRY